MVIDVSINWYTQLRIRIRFELMILLVWFAIDPVNRVILYRCGVLNEPVLLSKLVMIFPRLHRFEIYVYKIIAKHCLVKED